jgi:hypothetical protein
MSKFKKDLPIYVLSASLVFFGITTATQANAHPTDSSRIRLLEMQLSNFKSCVNRQLTSISFYRPASDRTIFVTSCY